MSGVGEELANSYICGMSSPFYALTGRTGEVHRKIHRIDFCNSCCFGHATYAMDWTPTYVTHWTPTYAAHWTPYRCYATSSTGAPYCCDGLDTMKCYFVQPVWTLYLGDYLGTLPQRHIGQPTVVMIWTRYLRFALGGHPIFSDPHIPQHQDFLGILCTTKIVLNS